MIEYIELCAAAMVLM